MDWYTREKMMNFNQHEIAIKLEREIQLDAAKLEEIKLEATPKAKSLLNSLLIAFRLKPAQY